MAIVHRSGLPLLGGRASGESHDPTDGED